MTPRKNAPKDEAQEHPDSQAEESDSILDEPQDYRNAHICQRCLEADWGIGARNHCGKCPCCQPK